MAQQPIDQHGPHSIKVTSATNHEAPCVLDGLLHHGTLLKIDTLYTDAGGASDHVFILLRLAWLPLLPTLARNIRSPHLLICPDLSVSPD